MSRISAFTLVVPDYDAAIAFYVSVLNFELVENTDLGSNKRWVVVRPPNAETSIVLAKAAGLKQEAVVGNQCGDRVGFFLSVEDFTSEHKRLSAAGVHFEEAPRTEPMARSRSFKIHSAIAGIC